MIDANTIARLDAIADGAFDYELNRLADTEWFISVTDYTRDGEVENLVAEFASEGEAYVAWEQLRVAHKAERGVSFLGKLTAVWVIKWFDAEDFVIASTSTTNEGIKNQMVETLEDAGTPYRMAESEIEHWTENPLFAL
jgi:hypothetical protein